MKKKKKKSHHDHDRSEKYLRIWNGKNFHNNRNHKRGFNKFEVENFSGLEILPCSIDITNIFNIKFTEGSHSGFLTHFLYEFKEFFHLRTVGPRHSGLPLYASGNILFSILRYRREIEF